MSERDIEASSADGRERAEQPKGENAASATAAGEGAPVELAVFDFDGTSMRGNSPVMLVRHLALNGMLKPSVVTRILLWAACYKLRLPQSEAWVRGLVFRAFAGKPKDEVDAYLRQFYDDKVSARVRDKAVKTMQAHRNAGRVVVVVSATFEPIVERAGELLPFDHQISTRMRIDGAGNYTCHVEGEPVEGEEKPRAIERFANERFGAGNWTLAWAYGDHHSDRPMLRAAQHAVAVNPDQPLTREARREGWEIADW